MYGKCLVLPSDKTVRDILVLFPPELKRVPTIRFFLNGGIRLGRLFDTKPFHNSLNYENNCRRIKKRFSDPNTWYCMCFAAVPDRQGKGADSRLIKPVLHILDEYRIPLYLETHKEINTHIYNHLGFDVVDVSSTLRTDTTQYAMLRAGSRSRIW